MAVVYLVRHGETLWNASGRIQGHSDTPLSELGYRQAEATARRLRDARLAAVWASDLQRAWRTAEPIAAAHGLSVVTVPGLREVHLGQWQGLTADEARARNPEEFARWRHDSATHRPPGGETLEELQERSVQALRAVLAEKPSAAVVAAHGGPIKSLICWALEAPLIAISRLRIDNASISVLTIDAGRSRVEGINDTAHLAGLRSERTSWSGPQSEAP